MADNFLCLIGAIDRLWFHQTILFSEPISLHDPKSTETPQQSIITSSFTYPSSNLSLSPLTDEEISSADFSSLLHQQNPSDSPQMCATPQDDDSNNEEYDDDEKDQFKQQKKRPITRLNILANRLMLLRSTSSASSSSAPAAAARKLHKSMSCRSLGELELEEVKGFMDLGFTFKKENLSPRMMSLVPGLQRLGVGELQNSSTTAVDQVATKDGGDDDGDEVGVPRPYLSEAWLIKRPDSPLLNLRLPRVSAAADMKKHLRFWARTVASEVHQES